MFSELLENFKSKFTNDKDLEVKFKKKNIY